MAPEILIEQGYDHYIDWWAVGVIMYECLIGYAPFSCQDPEDTCMLILDWKNSLEFPGEDEIELSDDAIDLIEHLITGRKNRYGYTEIMNHPWLKGLDPKTIRQTKAPWIPPVQSEVDTQHFDQFDDPNYDYFFGTENDSQNIKPRKELDEKQLPFVGWTFKRFEKKANKPRLEQIFQDQQASQQSLVPVALAKTPREKDPDKKKDKTSPKDKKSEGFKTTIYHEKERKDISPDTFVQK